MFEPFKPPARFLYRVGLGFSDDQVSFLAGGLCYFVFFSIFPLMLVLVAIAGHFLSAEETMAQATRVVAEIFPHQKAFLMDLLRQVMEFRGQATLLGFVALLWTGKNVFLSFGHAMNEIWHVPGRNWFIENLLSTLVCVSFGILIVATSSGLAIASALAAYKIPYIGWSPAMFPGALAFLVGLGPLLSAWLILTALYKILPNRYLRWREVAPGAAVAAIAWEGVRRLFGWYLEHVARYEMVYGSLGGIVGFLFWIYVSALIFLLGVEIAKALKDPPSEPVPF